MGLYGSLIGIPASVTVEVEEAARWMGILSLTFGVVVDLDRGLCVIVFENHSIAGFSEGKLSYND